MCWGLIQKDIMDSEEMMRLITPAMKLLEKYNHPFYVVYTNTPGEIVYEDEYQVVVKAGEDLLIEEVQPSWSEQYIKGEISAL